MSLTFNHDYKLYLGLHGNKIVLFDVKFLPPVTVFRDCRRASVFFVPDLLTALAIDSYKADSIAHTSDECGSSCLEKKCCRAQYITHVTPNYKINYAI